MSNELKIFSTHCSLLSTHCFLLIAHCFLLIAYSEEEFMEHFIWLNDPIDPHLSEQLTGKFRAAAAWAECVLELHFTKEGVLKGQFTVGKQTLEVKGGIGKTGMAYGFLLEPMASVPVALFRIKPSGETLNLEFDVPEFDELLEHCTLEQVSFDRVKSISKSHDTLVTRLLF
jgi:hypothetical protein